MITSYQPITQRQLDDIVCHLINWGYDSENNIRKMPFHTIIKRFKWFKKVNEDNQKRVGNNIEAIARLSARYVMEAINGKGSRKRNRHK